MLVAIQRFQREDGDRLGLEQGQSHGGQAGGFAQAEKDSDPQVNKNYYQS
jgi:hypothetical protein